MDINMRLRACAAILLFLSACATSAPSTGAHGARPPRFTNLQRAAALPWTDDGRCAVREASQPWPALVEKCFSALDHDRIRFNDPSGRCAVASAGAAAMGIGFCVLAAPEIAVGAVVVIGALVVAVAIKEALDAYELKGSWPAEEVAEPRIKPVLPASSEHRDPKPAPSPQDVFPPAPPESLEYERRPECRPIPGPPRGGNDPHNQCANDVRGNAFRGLNVLVNGKYFDALVPATRTLWEVKTDDFEKQPLRSQDFFVKVKLPELRREQALANACGYDFVIGVRSKAHKQALLRAESKLKVVLMDWC